MKISSKTVEAQGQQLGNQDNNVTSTPSMPSDLLFNTFLQISAGFFTSSTPEQASSVDSTQQIEQSPNSLAQQTTESHLLLDQLNLLATTAVQPAPMPQSMPMQANNLATQASQTGLTDENIPVDKITSNMMPQPLIMNSGNEKISKTTNELQQASTEASLLIQQPKVEISKELNRESIPAINKEAQPPISFVSSASPLVENAGHDNIIAPIKNVDVASVKMQPVNKPDINTQTVAEVEKENTQFNTNMFLQQIKQVQVNSNVSTEATVFAKRASEVNTENMMDMQAQATSAVMKPSSEIKRQPTQKNIDPAAQFLMTTTPSTIKHVSPMLDSAEAVQLKQVAALPASPQPSEPAEANMSDSMIAVDHAATTWIADNIKNNRHISVQTDEKSISNVLNSPFDPQVIPNISINPPLSTADFVPPATIPIELNLSTMQIDSPQHKFIEMFTQLGNMLSHAAQQQINTAPGIADSTNNLNASALSEAKADLKVEWFPAVSPQAIEKEIYDAKIKIYPPDLGHLVAKLKIEKNDANLIILTETNQAKEIIEANLPQLRQNFQNADINLVNVQVQTAEPDAKQQNQSSAHNNDASFSRQQQHETNSPSLTREGLKRKSQTIIDTYA